MKVKLHFDCFLVPEKKNIYSMAPIRLIKIHYILCIIFTVLHIILDLYLTQNADLQAL